MHPHDPMRRMVLGACIGASALLGRCLVFDGKTASSLDGPIDSGVRDSDPDGAPGPDAGAPDPGIRCGANQWCSPGTVCCLKLGASGWFGPSTPCSAPGTCDNFSEFACDTVRECGDGSAAMGESCCATRDSVTTEFQGSSCVPLGACTSLAVVLCTPTESAPCPARQSCVAADAGELPPGYYACQ
jgi:hypothetical protein